MNGIARYRQVRAQMPPEQLVLALLRESVSTLGRLHGATPTQWAGHLHRVRAIVIELRAALDPQVDTELVGRLDSLYGWSLQTLIEAGRTRDLSKTDAVRGVLGTVLEGWLAVVEQPLAAK